MLRNQQLELGRLFFKMCRLRAKIADQCFEQIGLFRGQAIMLILLDQNEGATHSEIAEKLEISLAAASKVIKRLEKMSYLQRRPDASDERVSRLYLQEKGRAVIGEIRASFQQMDETTFQGLSQQELTILLDLLTRIQSNIEATQPCASRLPAAFQPLPK